MADERDGLPSTLQFYGAERAKAFTDAVVAIAMTLLILPLMESVSDLAVREEGAATWVVLHQQQLISFVISFAVIAMFWMNHHRLFAHIEQTTTALLWIVMAWLLTIVWLPVATSMTGQMSADDTLAKTLYIGSMSVTCLVTLAQRLYLRAHPQLHELSAAKLREGIALDLSMAILFAVALAVAVLVPVIGYAALLLLFATGLATRLMVRVLH